MTQAATLRFVYSDSEFGEIQSQLRPEEFGMFSALTRLAFNAGQGGILRLPDFILARRLNFGNVRPFRRLLDRLIEYGLVERLADGALKIYFAFKEYTARYRFKHGPDATVPAASKPTPNARPKAPISGQKINKNSPNLCPESRGNPQNGAPDQIRLESESKPSDSEPVNARARDAAPEPTTPSTDPRTRDDVAEVEDFKINSIEQKPTNQPEPPPAAPAPERQPPHPSAVSGLIHNTASIITGRRPNRPTGSLDDKPVKPPTPDFLRDGLAELAKADAAIKAKGRAANVPPPDFGQRRSDEPASAVIDRLSGHLPEHARMDLRPSEINPSFKVPAAARV